MKLLHGSINGHIDILKATSIFHDSPNLKVVYLTENPLYALLYIWDGTKNKSIRKHVTSWIKDDIVYYEEQFSNQLRKFYEDVSGYLYGFYKNSDTHKSKSESVWYSLNDVKINEVEFIEDVYSELVKYEESGQLVVQRYDELNDELRDKVNMKMADYIIRKEFLALNDEEAEFYRTHHVEAWEIAKIIYNKSDLRGDNDK